MSTGPAWSQQRLPAFAAAGVPAVPAGRVVLGLAEMIIHLTVQRGFHHDLGQALHKAALTGQP